MDHVCKLLRVSMFSGDRHQLSCRIIKLLSPSSSFGGPFQTPPLTKNRIDLADFCSRRAENKLILNLRRGAWHPPIATLIGHPHQRQDANPPRRCLPAPCLPAPCHATIVASHVVSARVPRAVPLAPRRHRPACLLTIHTPHDRPPLLTIHTPHDRPPLLTIHTPPCSPQRCYR